MFCYIYFFIDFSVILIYIIYILDTQFNEPYEKTMPKTTKKIPKTFAEAIAQWRISRRNARGFILRQGEASQLLGFRDGHTEHNWERGKSFPQKVSWNSIFILTGVDPERYHDAWVKEHPAPRVGKKVAPRKGKSRVSE